METAKCNECGASIGRFDVMDFGGANRFTCMLLCHFVQQVAPITHCWELIDSHRKWMALFVQLMERY